MEVNKASERLKRVKAEGVDTFYKEYLAKMKDILTCRNQVGFYTHLTAMDLEGKRTANSKYVKDDYGKLLQSEGHTPRREARISPSVIITVVNMVLACACCSSLCENDESRYS